MPEHTEKHTTETIADYTIGQVQVTKAKGDKPGGVATKVWIITAVGSSALVRGLPPGLVLKEGHTITCIRQVTHSPKGGKTVAYRYKRN